MSEEKTDADFDAGKKAFEEKDFANAFGCFMRSAENGNAEAQFRIGNMLYYGIGTRQDLKKALMWFRKGAENGNADAQNELGLMYATGRNTQRSPAKAFEWTEKAA